jgi:hypothetical protein
MKAGRLNASTSKVKEWKGIKTIDFKMMCLIRATDKYNHLISPSAKAKHALYLSTQWGGAEPFPASNVLMFPHFYFVEDKQKKSTC